MGKTILLILIGKRKDSAVKVQQILTGWGCLIKTRLGIHDGILENCSDEGLVICELVGTKEQKEELARKLAVIPEVNSKLVELSL
ncbi:MAG: hypothetical protein GX452_08825 [Ignavibacteriales bacterium]|nr:hypothetical protein [Ignavibacteriaceae bacterium]NLH61495.1 hypothetical protein [Ignavibacteriales bacterium]HOJ18840.1 hypothetical protein [Ignavibacteriaceae bacterium]HPO55691.1 hypothetical protein [Ignavibacteriaceae bacterium]